jgi:hypothetical protein
MALVGGGLAAWLCNISDQRQRNRSSSRKTSSDDPYDGCGPARRRLLSRIADPPKSHERRWRHRCGLLPRPFQSRLLAGESILLNLHPFSLYRLGFLRHMPISRYPNR